MDPGFPVGVSANPRGGGGPRQLTILANFSKKLHEIEKKFDRRATVTYKARILYHCHPEYCECFSKVKVLHLKPDFAIIIVMQTY